jgi:protein-glutamine gamma-glutamyltransferase
VIFRSKGPIQEAPIAGTIVELKPHERSEAVQGGAMVLMFIASMLACLPLWGRLDSIILLSPMIGSVLSFLLRRRAKKSSASKGSDPDRIAFMLLLPINVGLYLIAFSGNTSTKDAFGLLPIAIMACIVLTSAMVLKPTASRLGLMAACITALLLIQLAISQSLAPSILSGVAFFVLWSALASRRNSDLGDRTQRLLKGCAFGLKTATLVIGATLPLIIAFFLLFPRLPLDAIRNEQPAQGAGSTGLSDSLTLGSISELKKSQEPAFTVSFKTKPPKESSLYWRSIVLDKLVGQRWISSSQTAAATPNPAQDATNAGEAKEQERGVGVSGKADSMPYAEIIDANNRSQQIAVLDGTEGKVFISFDDQGGRLVPFSDETYSITELARKFGRSKVKIHAIGAVAYPKAKPASPPADDVSEFLNLPAGFNPKTQAFGKKLREKNGQPEKVVEEVLRMIHQEEFRYTLKAPELGPQAIDDFFFKTRAGFCEHYASTFVVLMRGAGIPARLVTGYLSGPASGGELSVSQGDAHAWAEVWFADRGWVRQDPTASIDPSRVDPDATNARLESTPDGFLGFLNVTWRKQSASAELFWKGTMLEFDAGAQTRIFKEIGLDRIGKPLLAAAVILLMAGLGVAWQYMGAGFMSILRPARKNTLSAMLERQCEKAGLERLPGQTWREFLGAAKGKLSKEDLLELKTLVAQYEHITYGQAGLRDKKLHQSLSYRIKRFQPKAPKTPKRPMHSASRQVV